MLVLTSDLNLARSYGVFNSRDVCPSPSYEGPKLGRNPLYLTQIPVPHLDIRRDVRVLVCSGPRGEETVVCEGGGGVCVAHSGSSCSFNVNNRAIAMLIVATELTRHAYTSSDEVQPRTASCPVTLCAAELYEVLPPVLKHVF
jgi:hypothetical protein